MNCKFVHYLFEYLYRQQIACENRLVTSLNTLQLASTSCPDTDLLSVIRCKERCLLMDRVVADIWRIYDFSMNKKTSTEQNK